MQTIICKDQERLDNILFILKRDSIEYTVPKESPLTVNLPNSTEDDVVIIEEDADCEEQRKKVNPMIPVYSLKTTHNRDKIHRLMELNHCRCYHILAKDKEEYDNEYA